MNCRASHAMESAVVSKKEIACHRSLGHRVVQVRDIVEALTDFTTRAAERLRRQDGCASQVLVFIHTSPFWKQDYQYSRVPSRSLCTGRLRTPTARSLGYQGIACHLQTSRLRIRESWRDAEGLQYASVEQGG